MTLTAGGSGKQRSIRTDWHSKIHTAQGLRDRRMRLSLEVARKFFSLQDLLGFDKASATLDWLITQSRSAIEQHLVHFARATAKDVPSDSSLSANGSVKRLSLKKKDVLRSASFRKISLRHLLTKESRAVARARAREERKRRRRRRCKWWLIMTKQANLPTLQTSFTTGMRKMNGLLVKSQIAPYIIRQAHWLNEEWRTSTFEW